MTGMTELQRYLGTRAVQRLECKARMGTVKRSVEGVNYPEEPVPAPELSSAYIYISIYIYLYALWDCAPSDILLYYALHISLLFLYYLSNQVRNSSL